MDSREKFLAQCGLSVGSVQNIIDDSLLKADDGELYLQYHQNESVIWDDGRVKSAGFDVGRGFGLRLVSGEVSGYAHSSEVSEASLKRAANSVQAVQSGYVGSYGLPPQGTNQNLYSADNPLELISFNEKVLLLESIDNYARSLDGRIRQVSSSVSASWEAIHIMRSGGVYISDIRPLLRLNVSIVMEKDGRMERGDYGYGGRQDFVDQLSQERWQFAVDDAVRQASVNMESRAAPAGEMSVVLGSGWPGILLHEAVGHGLEGDFNRKETSAFSGRVGDQVASRGVTVLDDGTLLGRRGSLNVDDEGTATSRTVLIEDGILKGYMQDRLNGRLMGVSSTGNCRRESYAHVPMPRMTNTYMLNGACDPSEIIGSVDHGIYAVNFGGGQVDITNGKFVFSCTEAYMIEGGKVKYPIKGATLIGSGADAMQKISMIGNDMALDSGVGTCGKNGQGVPVGVGQPTIRLDNLTVGGTAA